MRITPRSIAPVRCVLMTFCALALSSIPATRLCLQRPSKLVVVIIIDQFRCDYLERYRDQFADGGFRLLLDHGANFSDCNYDYANTRTAPGHSTLFTGAYSDGHGIAANEWWDQRKRKMVTSVEDDATRTCRYSRRPGQKESRRLAAQSACRHAGRRTQARHAGKI